MALADLETGIRMKLTLSALHFGYVWLATALVAFHWSLVAAMVASTLSMWFFARVLRAAQ